MRVIATNVGYYEQIREVGDEFEVPDGTEGSWIVPVCPVQDSQKQDNGDKEPSSKRPR